jgi:hypothetical protein
LPYSDSILAALPFTVDELCKLMDGLFNGTTQVDYTHMITQEYHVTQIIWNTTEVEKSLDFNMTTQSNSVRKKRDVLFKHKKFNLKTSADQHSKQGL